MDRTSLGLDRATQSKLLWAAVGAFLLYICASEIGGLVPLRLFPAIC